MARTLAIRQLTELLAAGWVNDLAGRAQMRYIHWMVQHGDHLALFRHQIEVDTVSLPGIQSSRFRKELTRACEKSLYLYSEELWPYYLHQYGFAIFPRDDGQYTLDFTVVLTTLEPDYA